MFWNRFCRSLLRDGDQPDEALRFLEFASQRDNIIRQIARESGILLPPRSNRCNDNSSTEDNNDNNDNYDDYDNENNNDDDIINFFNDNDAIAAVVLDHSDSESSRSGENDNDSSDNDNDNDDDDDDNNDNNDDEDSDSESGLSLHEITRKQNKRKRTLEEEFAEIAQSQQQPEKRRRNARKILDL